jgi:hypothetical protein
MLNAHAAVLEAAFADRRFGMFRSSLDLGHVRFVQEPTRLSTRTATPGQVDTWTVALPAGTERASLAIAWGPVVSPSDLGLALADPDGVVRATSNTLNLLGLTGRRERVAVDRPAPGDWHAEVRHSLAVAGSQSYTAALDVSRVELAPIVDLDALAPDARDAVLLAVRTLAMAPYGNRFRPSHPVTRAALAGAMVRAGRVPQYLAAAPAFADVRDPDARLGVESACWAPGGPLFPDAVAGAPFGPHAAVDRLLAAVVLVRAAGLAAEAEARAAELPPVADAAAIAPVWRGYVSVALERGLMAPRDGAFEPGGVLTRAELAAAIAVLVSER